MVGIDFCIANNEKEAAVSIKTVKFEEAVQDYLLENKFEDSFELLTGLDQYDDKLFSVQEINQLIKICEALQTTCRQPTEIDLKARTFSEALERLCLEALKLNKLVFAAGD
ncbi:hypothetical protein [Priestia megaterium]|uniref:hypothetical protein n=1 Tax=Priestia megaterium TaxID=1404 RepID=UPI000BF9E181|nr:hypothetical protein [Priestia megaterium]MED4061067.1 hypothetical protein [Priestia megaterium]PEZ07126.1 hypothetical protein CN330_26060 [Priestia megaterium]